MSERERDRAGRTEEEEAALAALRRVEPPVVPDEVRERARRAFLTGRPEVGPPHRIEDRSMRRGRVRPRGTWVAAIAAAAAVVLLVNTGLQPVGVWRVTEVVAPDAIELPAGVSAVPGARLRATRHSPVRVGEASELELTLDARRHAPASSERPSAAPRLRVRLISGTEASIPAPPARWVGRNRTLEVRHGEIFGATSGPLGFRLRLRTLEAEAVLSGTSFAVIRNEEATCFCLYRGHLDITDRKSGRAVALPLEHRVVIYRDGRPPRLEPITDRERMKLSMMDAAAPTIR